MESLPVDTSDDPCDKTCDTVEVAQKTPHKRQPYRQLGLTQQEYDRIVAILQRRPTDAELAMYSVMWSEHCSYKSSKKYLRYFGHTTTEEMKKNILAGIGENAGVIDIGNNWAVTFKVESHNHPSFIEPYQGAATGVGGIVRDIIAMGARPIAVMDQLRFGAVTSTDTFRIVDGVVRGIAGYANSLGLPNIGGETVFDASYNGNPLVNVLCVGVMPKDQIHTAHASGVGNRIILFGARTGLDGIGGVSVLASETFGDATEQGAGTKKLPSVQVGDPFVEKLLIECCQELFAADVVVSIQDLGGAGLSCATSELAAAGEGGMYIDLDRVPLRTTYMTAAEILSSESQERMCAVVAPENVPRFLEICARWEVLATDIGYVNDSNRLTMSWHGHTVVDVPPRTVAHEGPEYDRPIQRPARQDALNADSTIHLARPRTPTELTDTLLTMISSPHLASKRFIIEQYDRYVRGNTILAGTEDAGMIRVDEATGKGIALATDCSGRYTLLDPYHGAQLALAEAYRNVSCSGAVAQAVTNCLNFGSPEDPGVMWQLQQAIYGLADGCAQLGIPVISGNVSLYNQTGNMAIMPTPVVGVLGVIEDVQWRTSSFFSPTPGDALYLLGNTYDEFDGSAWAQIMYDHLGGIPPKVDLAAEKVLASILCAAAKGAMISSAHDLSEGGLWQAIVESALGGQQGCRIIPPKDIDPFVFLLSESSARVLISVPRAQEPRLIALLNTRSQPYFRIGVVDQVPEIQIQDVGVFSLAELSAAYESTLPKIFGHIFPEDF